MNGATRNIGRRFGSQSTYQHAVMKGIAWSESHFAFLMTAKDAVLSYATVPQRLAHNFQHRGDY